MIKEALLGLLAVQPMHGYDLKVALDRLLGRTSPFNVGQVYTALAKLERDGTVAAERVARDGGSETRVFRLTPAGTAELQRWFAEPVVKAGLRDELFIKLSLARRTGRADALAIIRSQRTANLRAIQELTELKDRHDASEDIDLLIDGAILHLEADIRWLDLWAERLKG